MKEFFTIHETFKVSPKEIYHAWLNSALHSEMTGGEAECSDEEGGRFSAWDGYITGRNLDLLPGQRIVQSWRTTEFDEADEDSMVTIELKEDPLGCKLILTHTNIPAGQTQYKQGWEEHYFEPMGLYFN